MDDLISRQAAIDYCYALINAENPSDPSDEWNYSQERINQTEVILHHLEFMPSAQPEIIRCKDCKHRGEKPIADGRYWCELHDTFMYYCSDRGLLFGIKEWSCDACGSKWGTVHFGE